MKPYIKAETAYEDIRHALLQETPLRFEELHNSGDLAFMLPELDQTWGYDQVSPYHTQTLWDHTMSVVFSIPKSEETLRWAGLFHDLGKIPVAKEKDFNPEAKTGNEAQDALREKYTGTRQRNYVGHERLSEFICLRYMLWWKDAGVDVTDFDWVVLLVGAHMHENSPLRPYDIEAH